MLALRKTGPQPGLNFEEVAAPGAPGPDEALIQVEAAGICGSDLHVYDWDASYEFMRARLPVTIGHEFCGRVVALGSQAAGLAEGDLVAVVPTASCMKCQLCAAGQPQRCLSRSTLGLTRDGAFARQVRVPALSCIRLAGHTLPALAAMLEPLAVGDNAALVGEIGFGDTVVVLGPGTIGQAIARAARWRGAERVVVVGKGDGPRLRTALAVGATHAIDLEDGLTLPEALEQALGAGLADVVVEATGHPSSVADGLSILRKDGVLVSAGIHARPASLDITALVRNRQQIRGAHASRRTSWLSIARRIAEQPEDVLPMVSAELPLAEGLQGFAQCRARAVSKIILRPGD